MTDEPIWRASCVNHPECFVTVSHTVIGTYRVVFSDNEEKDNHPFGKTIGIRIFNSIDAANRYANSLINQAS